jgi:hypothetical protein
MKTQKRTFLIASLVAVLGLVPMGAYGNEEISGPPPTPLTGQMSANTTPVEQPLVPEGVFAVQLVEALKMGEAQEEAQAESMLSAIGIEPKNGWIAGYPVTPPIIGEIEKGVAGAADAGKLGMEKNQALKAVGDLKARLGLSVTSGVPPQTATLAALGGQPASTIIYKYTDEKRVVHYTDRYESIPKEYRDQIEMIRETVQPMPSGGAVNEDTQAGANNYTPNQEPEVINNYYYNYGPPVVTYYAPPAPYYYLYGWVPYPFWSSGFFFSGFFILHDFHRHVVFHNRPFVVTNHVVAANRAFVVDPVSRNLRGSFASGRIPSSQVFRSPAVQSSARQIVGLTQHRMASAGVSTVPRMRNVTAPTSIRPSQSMFHGRAGVSRDNWGHPQVSGGSNLSRPAVSGRYIGSASPRVFNAPPSFSRGQSFSSPSYRGRSSFGGYHGGGGSFGGFHGGGGGFRGGGGSRGRR